MSLLPYFVNELLGNEMSRPRRYDFLDDVLLRDVRPSAMLRLLDDMEIAVPQRLLAERALRDRHAKDQQRKKERADDARDDNDAVAINVDVQHFRPEELSVRVDKNERSVVIEGKHEERPDVHGYVRRQFTRRYKLPLSVDPDTVVSRLSPDGVLRVSAPCPALPAPNNVRYVSIQHCEQPAVETLDSGVNSEDGAKSAASDLQQ